MTGILFAGTLLAALACGLVAGVFYGFSSFVMQGLGRLPAPQGIAAMQSINVTAVRPPFMAGFMGATLVCLVFAVVGVVRLGEPDGPWLLAGAVLYLVGTFGVTMAANVPRNDAMARLDADAAGSAASWSAYVVEWTRWNTVRTLGALAATAAFTVALTTG